MSEKSRFRGLFDKHHCKRAQTVMYVDNSNFTIFIDHCERH